MKIITTLPMDTTRRPPAANRIVTLIASVAISLCSAGLLNGGVIDDFEDGPRFAQGRGGMDYLQAGLTNGQLVISGRFPGPNPLNNPLLNYDNIYWSNSWQAISLPGRTLEVRMDLVRASADDVFFILGVDGPSGGYHVMVDQNEIALWKFSSVIALPFWTNAPVRNQDVTVVLALTGFSNTVQIVTRVLDRRDGAILYEQGFLDGPGSDVPAPTPPPRGITICRPDPGAPLTTVLVAWAGVFQWTATNPAPLEVVVDNLEYDLYDAPLLKAASSLQLSWPENTAEEQVVLGSDSLAGDAVWAPWPEPILKRFGGLSVTVPATAAQQFFKLVPGTQFMDDFSPAPQWPFTTKGEWVPGFYVTGDAYHWTVTNLSGTLRIQTTGIPLDPGGRLPLLPPGPVVAVGDFWAAVDVLDLATTHPQGGIGIGARVVWNPVSGWPGNANGYLGSLKPSRSGVNQARLALFTGDSPAEEGVVFTYRPGTPYRLIFSGVGQRLTVELIDLTLQKPAVEALIRNNSNFNRGLMCLWGQAGAGTCTMSLDNFFVTGTKP